MVNTKQMANMQVNILVMMVGNIISEEFELPAFSLKPIIVVGNSWIDTEFITNNIIPQKVILPLPLSIDCIAFIPLGVAAFPSPKMLEERLTAIYLMVVLSFVLNILLIPYP